MNIGLAEEPGGNPPCVPNEHSRFYGGMVPVLEDGNISRSYAPVGCGIETGGANSTRVLFSLSLVETDLLHR